MDATRSEPVETIDSIALEAVATPPNLTNARETRHSSAQLGQIVRDAADAMVGHQIGPYQVVARIGGGRVGTVYHATRVDEFAPQVAIKLINREIDSDALAQRLQTDLRVQAALGKHPNIAPFLDAGTTEDGRSYVVMEYVEGQHVDEYCDKRYLDVPARLGLFAQVCRAVQFAHQYAVIHRDLKPSNILVTTNGTPKIIDFGIANLVEPENGIGPGDCTVKETLTRTATWVPTPAYTSSEQVKGEAVTTATDVYSLGVVLYGLLCGRWPYQLKWQRTSEIFRAICEQIPEKPSAAIIRRSATSSVLTDPLSSPCLTSPPEPWPVPVPLSAMSLSPTPEEIATARGVSPHRLRQILAGDLDTIVLMALRQEPERRYASAEHLGEDVQRYLKGMPVRSHRDSLAYRASKFIQRYAIAVAAGFVLLSLLAAGLIGLATGLVTVRRERDRANESFHKACQVVNQLFTHISEDRLLNQPGMHALRRELLLDARGFYEDFLNQRVAGPEHRAELANVQARIAKISNLTGSGTEAVAQYYEAIALWKKLVTDDPGNHDYQEKLAETLYDLGVALAREEDRFDETLGTFDQAQKIVELLISAHSDSVSHHLKLGMILLNIAKIQMRQGKSEQAVRSIERMLEIELQLVEEDSDSLEPRIALAMAYATLGRLLSQQPTEFLPAITAYQQAIKLHDTVTREQPEFADLSYQLASELSDLSGLQQKIGQPELALEYLRKALQILERIDQLYPGVVLYHRGLGTTYNMMSDLERQRGEKIEALAFAQKARILFEHMIAENPKNACYRRDLSKSYNNLGRLQAQAGEFAEALHSFQRAIDLFESLHELNPQDSYDLACNIALCLPLIDEINRSHSTSQRPSKKDQLRQRLYGDRAIEVLRQAAKAGFVNPQNFQNDSDLNSLRARGDFQALMREVEEKTTNGGK